MLKPIKLNKEVAKQVKVLNNFHHNAQAAFQEASRNLRETSQKMWKVIFADYPDLKNFVCNLDAEEMTVTPLYPTTKKED